MAGLVVTLIALGTLAFGAVYPWAYLPLFAVAALIGLVGLRHGIRREVRPLALSLLLLLAAVAVQLLPVPRPVLDAVSPRAATILGGFSVAFAGGAAERVPVSIDPRNTQVAALALGAFGLYLLGLTGSLGRSSLRRIPLALAMFAVPLALFGILNREYGNYRVYWVWEPQNPVGAAVFGPFINRNHFGGWMLMTVCVMVGSLFGQIERASRERGGRRQTRLAWLSSAEANSILMMGAAVIVGVVSLFWTLSRSAITGFAASTVAFAWLAYTRRRLGATLRAVTLTALGALLLTGIAWRGTDLLVRRFQDDSSLVSRLDAWRDGWAVVRDFPLMGTGLNTYSDAMLFYQTRNRDFHLAQAHNDYLQLLAEGGLLVAIPAALAIVVFARAVRRNLRAARGEARGYWIRAGAAVGLLAMAVQEVFEFSLQMPANTLLFCTLAAMTLTATSGQGTRRVVISSHPKGEASGALP